MNLSPPRKLYWWAVSFIGGVLGGAYFNFSVAGWLFWLFLGAWLVSLAFRHSIAFFILGCLFFILGGNVLFNINAQRLNYWRQNKKSFNESSQMQEIEGRVVSEFERRQENARFVMRTDQGEKILVFTNRYPYISYGTTLTLRGKLQIPGDVEGFDWQGYLAQKGIYKVVFYPGIEAKTPPSGFSFRRGIYSYKQEAREFIKKNFLFVEGQILRAILLGDKSISDRFREKLSRTGTNHIVAISGLHIMIFITICFGVGFIFGLSRLQATFLAFLVCLGFVFLTGFRISSLRAFLMAGSLYGSYILGRLSRSDHALVLLAGLMLAFNPLLVRYNVGFQLSFLALLGIIYFRDFFKFCFQKLGLAFPGDEVVYMSLGAQIGVLPIVSYNFGRLSLLALAVNTLVVPVMAVVMAGGVLAVFVGLFYPAIKSIFVYCLSFILDYVIGVISLFSQFGWGFYEFNASAAGVIVYYLVFLVLAFCWRYYYRTNLTPTARMEKIRSG